ncbi:exodeoxyribonuclease V subunit gamma [bacterium]|nr:exodeoxyribonuclease V subunit gamma [bacterium]
MIAIEFNEHIDFSSDDTIFVFPFRSDVERILEKQSGNFAIVGWKILSLRDFVEKIHIELFPDFDRLKPATRFAIIHRILLDSDFLKYFESYKRKTGIAESLVELFTVLDEAGILTESDIDSVLLESDNRTSDAIRLYRIFRDELSLRKFATSGDIFTNISNEVLTGDIPKILANKRRIILSNFLEFTIPQQNFIEALGKKFDVFIHFPCPKNAFPKNWIASIEKIAENFNIELNIPDSADGHWLSDALNGHPANAYVALSSTNNKIPDFALLEIPDVQREVELVAKIAKYFSVKQKIPPDEIFIITPNPERYEPLLANAFERAKIPNNFRKITDSTVDIYMLFVKIITAIETNWRRRELFDLLKHPILNWQFPELEQLERMSIRSRIMDKRDWLNSDFDGFVPITKLIKSLVFLGERFNTNRFPEFLGKIADAIKLLKFPDDNGNKKELIQSKWEEILKDGDKLAKGYGNFDILSGIELLRSFLHISKNTNEKSGSDNSGVRIFDIDNGRNTDCSLAFFVGFGENNFPVHHKKNAILMQNYDEFVPFVPDKMQVQNLSLILGLISAEKFYLTYPRRDNENDIGRSQPIDEIFRFCKGDNETQNIPTALDIFRLLKKYELTEFDNIFNEAIKILSENNSETIKNLNFISISEKLSKKRISVRELEIYSNCHLRYLLEHLVGETEPPSEPETFPYTELGNAIHKALELFYRNRYERIFGEAPPKLQLADISDLREIIDSYYKKINNKFSYLIDNLIVSNNTLDNAISELNKLIAIQLNINNWTNKKIPFSQTDVLEYTKGFTDKNFAKNILEREIEFTKKLGVKNLPFLFEFSLIVPINIDNKIVKISGRIDRIDMLEDGSVLLIDYKTGYANGTSSKENIKIGKLKLDKEIQLQIYALLMHNLGFDISGLAYISRIRDWNGPYADFVMGIDIENIDEKIKSILFEFCSGNFDFTSDNTNCKYCPYVEQCALIRNK